LKCILIFASRSLRAWRWQSFLPRKTRNRAAAFLGARKQVGDTSKSLSKGPVFDLIFFCVGIFATPNKPVLQRLKRILIFASGFLRA